MSNLNNLKGEKAKDCKIIYSEKLINGLYFLVFYKYIPYSRYSGSSIFECEAMISTNNRYGYNNGLVEIETPNYIEVANEYGKFKEFDSFLTVDGFKVFQSAIENPKETDCRLEDGKIGRRKARKLIWNVEVPKE